MVISETTAQLNGAPRLKTGVQMIDDGIYTFEEDEYLEFISKEPNSIALFKKFVGGDEYINGHYRYILYLANTEPQILKSLPLVTERIQRVRDYRSKSSRSSTVAMSNYPTQLGVDERLSSSYLVIPNTSSERREYIPIGWLEPDIIANQKLRILANPDLYDFALLTSRMHMAWMRTITGRMKSDYMYSVGVVYNNFPWPDIDDAAKDKIRPLAQAILDARAAHEGATLADLYDPLTMPPDLRKAHLTLDQAIDRLYRREAFPSDRERVEHLFGLYEKLTADLFTEAPKKKGRKKR